MDSRAQALCVLAQRVDRFHCFISCLNDMYFFVIFFCTKSEIQLFEFRSIDLSRNQTRRAKCFAQAGSWSKKRSKRAQNGWNVRAQPLKVDAEHTSVRPRRSGHKRRDKSTRNRTLRARTSCSVSAARGLGACEAGPVAECDAPEPSSSPALVRKACLEQLARATLP